MKKDIKKMKLRTTTGTDDFNFTIIDKENDILRFFIHENKEIETMVYCTENDNCYCASYYDNTTDRLEKVYKGIKESNNITFMGVKPIFDRYEDYQLWLSLLNE